MSETEVQELIKVKREDLERRKADDSASSSLLKVLEDEIKELESSLDKPAEDAPRIEQAFLDECAG